MANLTPEQQKKIDDAVKLLNDIRLGEDVVFTESLRKRVLENVLLSENVDSTVLDINDTQSVASTPQDVSFAKEYDKRLKLNIDGIDYYIGLYNV